MTSFRHVLASRTARFACIALLLLTQTSCRRQQGSPVAPAVARTIQSPNELLWGPAATGAIGDFILENGKILAVITRDAATSGFAASAGNLADVAPLPDGEDHLNEIFLYLNDEFPRQAHYKKVKIIKKGGGKRPAKVRAIGVDTGDKRIKIVTDYILRPGASWVTIETRFTSSATNTISRYHIGDAIQWGRTEHMAPGCGFNLPGRRLEVDWLCGIGKNTSYAFVPDGNIRFNTLSGSRWSDPVGAAPDLKPKKTFTYVRHLVVGRGDTASLAPTVAKLRGDDTGRLTGTVTHEERPVVDAVVRILDEQGELGGLARVDRQGWYAIDLRPGKYHARAWAPGRTEVSARDELVQVGAGQTVSLNFNIGAQGIVAWHVRGDDGRAVAVRVVIEGTDGTSTPRFGPSFRGEGADNTTLSRRGVGRLPVSPGTYRVLISRGPEYELVEKTVKINAGETAMIEGTMVRSVDTTGFVSAELHQHAAPSFDSGVSLSDRALSNAAEGVEVLVATDHNTLIDYRPIIAESGLGRDVFSIIGVEATTHSVGHFNALPLAAQPGKPRGGMVDPEGWTPEEIFSFVRKLGAPGIETYLQVDHPRSRKTGYFLLMNLDPKTGVSTDPRYRSNFDGIEVVTVGVEEETESSLLDWYALLRRGHRYTGTGTSDSHSISLRPVGWPRTFVCSETDDPPKIDVAAFTAALKSGCATSSLGPFVTITAEGTKMGGLKRATNKTVEVEVTVQAPTWIGTDRLRIIVDGNTQKEIPLQTAGVMRHQAKHTITCAKDCFVVARVDSAKGLWPIIRKRKGFIPVPVAVTNPIYVDVNGDGRYAPSK